MRLSRHLLLAGLVLGIAACSDQPDDTLHGYAEGDFTAIAPDAPGRIVETLAREGAHVAVQQGRHKHIHHILVVPQGVQIREERRLEGQWW